MLKKTIKYKDFDGNEREEDFYFNLTKAEIMEMEHSEKGGLQHHLTAIVQAQDGKQIIATFKEIIKKAYGVKSPDGRSFVKSEEAFKEFESTLAYSDLFMELATNAEAAAKFVNAIIPTDPKEELNKLNK